MKKVFVTGGLGYVGSAVCAKLLSLGYQVTAFSRGSSSRPVVAGLIGLDYLQGDIRSYQDIANALDRVQPNGIVHCAGLKGVDASTASPVPFLETDVIGTHNLLKAIGSSEVRVVLTSSASVYAPSNRAYLTESSRLEPTTLYGQTKLFAESRLGLNGVALRCFNPAGFTVGVHSNYARSGNLFDVIRNTKGVLKVMGTHFYTPDGSSVKDYIHIEDVADAHVWALENTNLKYRAYNVGTGVGTSVIDIFKRTKREYGFVPSRLGDVARLVADTGLAKAEGFECKKTIEDIVSSELEGSI